MSPTGSFRREKQTSPTAGEFGLVATNFETVILHSNADVLLVVYAPRCGHCRRLEGHLTKIAERVADEGLTHRLICCKIDGTTNDSPDEEVITWKNSPVRSG